MARNVEFNEKEAVQKAMEVFWEKGYSGASLRDLTDAMQINSSSLYNTIGDKQELFVKCIKNYTEAKQEYMMARAEGAPSAFNAILNLVDDSVNAIINEDKSCMAIKTTFEIAIANKNIQAILKDDNDFVQRFIHTLIEKAKQDGALHEAADAGMLTDYFTSAITGWHQSYILHRDPIRIKKMAQFLVAQISG
jgi:TetR/AcrR family transcriptional repressor of nem operon